MKEMQLNDISNELLILNKYTIDKLFTFENCSDCVALYIFYYKTAKWQKNSRIKANDTYTKLCLKWGNDRLKKAKDILKANGLIEMVQNRINGKIDSWFIKVNYFVNEKKEDEIKILVESNNSQNQQLLNPNCGSQETNTINNNTNTINNNISTKENIDNNNTDVLSLSIKEKAKKTAFVPPTLDEIKEYCEKRNNGVDAQKFFDYYQANEWKDKNNKIVTNWKQKMIANWENKGGTKQNNREETIYTFI